jgi:hypothetical protein
MPDSDVVALVAADDRQRRGLRDHLRQLGFSVREIPSLAQASIYSRVVVHLPGAPDARVRASINEFLAGTGRLVVIAESLPGLRDLAAPHPQRLRALVPPVFPWQLRDALTTEDLPP